MIRNSNFLELPTLQENVSATQQVIPSDARDFSRPKEPNDSSMANDSQIIGDPFIIQVQKFMKSHGYIGSEDGVINSELLSVLRNFENIIQSKTGKPVIGTIVKGNKIDPKGFQEATGLSQPLSHSIDNTIISFQQFLSTAHPLIGILYKGALDGKINDELIYAAKNAEDIIANAINNPKAHGMLWNENIKNFNTSISDLQQSLNLIVAFQNSNKTKNAAILTRKQALLKISKKSYQ